MVPGGTCNVTGDPMVIDSAVDVEPALLLPVMVKVAGVEALAGVPLMIPVKGSRVNPAGKAGDAL